MIAEIDRLLDKPHVYVEDVEQTPAKPATLGGSPVVAPYPEGNRKVATFRGPGPCRGNGSRPGRNAAGMN